MSMPAGRSEKWTPMGLTVVLSCVGQRSSKERTFSENKSSLGLRVITKKTLHPRAQLLVTFTADNVGEQATAVYCQRLGNKKFAVALALAAKVCQLLV